jgi:hypothetical protein
MNLALVGFIACILLAIGLLGTLGMLCWVYVMVCDIEYRMRNRRDD